MKSEAIHLRAKTINSRNKINQEAARNKINQEAARNKINQETAKQQE